MASTEPIALIGSACRFPGDSDTPSKLWELLRNPRDLLRQVPPDRFNVDAFYHEDGKHHGTSNVRQSYFVDQDPATFDNGFFNIQAGEAEAIDPQQRMLMETVYESLCSAGQTIEGLRGSPTSVFVGVMCGDWESMIGRDMDMYPQYGAVGTARSIMSNRISYFFDWRGPCMTIDTACSSSLVAVHQAIQTLHSGESEVAIAAGANLILSPAMYVAESKLSMLSPTGRSRMWDKDVDGYARGEGIAAVVLKPLSAAIRDNDHIECIIRGTGVNQDGRTPGLTMPSGKAQAALIRDTYMRAGLDVENQDHRPQFFHAHGTGTAAGDPQEAQAIAEAFYSKDGFDDKLYVGSIKTIIGHTEGTAGLASLLGTSLALKHGLVPPNMHFNTLNPRLRPFYHHLEVPTKCISWPATRPGQARRASINSFGFGGTNAHAILEAYHTPEEVHEQDDSKNTVPKPLFSPLTFSASSETSLRSLLSSYSAYLRFNTFVDLHDFAYSLQTRTSTLSHRVAITAATKEDACSQIDSIASGDRDSTIGTRQLVKASPRILGIFTGQGSQWARMGAKLLEASPYVAQRLSELDKILAEEPASQCPSWTFEEMILADPESSRMGEAAISQPLCTAVQIVLVDLLRLASVKLHAVVGHSSGEIGAAYAAGLLSARDAIRAAYYRGLYANLAKSPHGGKGSMMAVGTTIEDATEFCELEDFEGRVQVAARNSSSSITLSGDEDAILEAVETFSDEGKFARQLKVDTAYHSSHVGPCAEPYRKALEKCDMDKPIPTGVKWYSSVREGEIITPGHLGAQYWIDNMTSPVLFSPAVASAWAGSGPFDIVIEAGPHPVLKTPCLDTIEDIIGDRPPYSGLLSRGKDDIQAFSNALGFIWTHLGPGSADFDGFEKAVSGNLPTRRFLSDLPKYPFDHSRNFMSLSRSSGLYRGTQDAPHPLLGRRCYDRETSDIIQWRNIMSPKEIPWMTGHQIQNQITFPATGYLAMAIEAINAYAGNASIGLIDVRDLRIRRALIFSDDNPSIEIAVHLKVLKRTDQTIVAEFSCYLGAPNDHRAIMASSALGTVEVTIGSPEPDQLPGLDIDDLNLNEVSSGRFYNFLAGLGYNYAWPFHGTTEIRRKADYAVGTIVDQSGVQWEDRLIAHPGMLDTALQTCFGAFCCPGDERLWTLHLPTEIRSVLVNPYFTPIGIGKQTELRYITTTRQDKSARIYADVHLYAGDFSQPFLQMEGAMLVPLTPATPSNDAVLFSKFDYGLAGPDGEEAAKTARYTRENVDLVIDSERISFYYFRQLLEKVTAEETTKSLPHFRHLLNYAAQMVPPIINGEHAYIPASAQFDTQNYISELVDKHRDSVSVRLLQSVGDNLPRTVQSGSSILEHMMKDSMLDRIYEEGFGLDQMNDFIAHMVGQIAHRYPRMNLFEIGAGTGGSTKRILQKLGSAFSTYTYTDISGSFFSKAKDLFKDFEDRMVFKTFDMDQTPESQGFTEGSYDIVIGSNVLHATLGLEGMMKNVRRLLKPGGYVIILEIVDNNCLRVGLTMGSLPGWWLGAETGRQLGPTLTLPQWDTLLSSCGFGGVETSTPTIHPLIPLHVFCAQALDERVEILRAPLTHLRNLPATMAPQLVIIGGKKLSIHRICERLASMFFPIFPNVIRYQSVQELSASGLVEASTVLSLTELDEPLFSANTPQKFDGLKTIWRHAKNILWVTTGARAEDPHSQMTNGVGRCMRSEHPNITLQILDIDRINQHTMALIAEHLIRLEVLSKWSTELRPGYLLWSLEPEVYIENDTTTILRLYPFEAINNRYNTTRRIVTEAVNPQQTELVFAIDEGSLEVRRPSPAQMRSALPFNCETRTIRVTHFLLPTLNVVPGARLRLCVGVDTTTQQTFLAVSPTDESPAVIPTDWCILQDRIDPVSALSVLSSYMVARGIMQFTTKGDTLVLHEPHPLVADTLQPMAKRESVTLFITSSERNVGREWHYVNKNFPERVVREVLPSTATKYLDLSTEPKASDIISRCLPRSCHSIDTTALLHTSIALRPFTSKDDVTCQLDLAWPKIASILDKSGDLPMIPVHDISTQPALIGSHFAIADCTSPSVGALVRPNDEGILFRNDRTYLMVGLSGELGQSLCKWMVTHGARYVVLTSRRPTVKPKFTSTMERMGATVKTLPMDVTNRSSARECYEAIVKTMPPIAGVANGAMVLIDNLFDKMPYEDFMKVTNPKVLGSLILDELFYDIPLDFFIFFSSTTAVLGNSGQSNYAAGNEFMCALAAQRKKRGLPASSVDISSIIGIGYVERDTVVDEFTFTKMGYRPMSEQDLHYAFAEAMVIGKVDYPGPGELVTGISPLHLGGQASDQFFRDLKFSHYILEHPEEQSGAGGPSSSQPVKVQLATAKTKVDVVSIIRDAFLVRLRRILAVSADEPINERVTFVEQGVDSLMAVEVRTWFLKELGVDFPVLRILGGSCIADLLSEAVNILPDSIIDVSGLEEGKKSKDAPVKPAPTPLPVQQSPASIPKEVLQRDGSAESTSNDSGSDVDGSSIKTPPSGMATPESSGESAAASPVFLKREDFSRGSPEIPLRDDVVCPMSFGQRGFWFLNEYLSDKTAFNMAVMIKITGPIRVRDLKDAVTMVGERHEIFRTRFFWADEGGGREPMQGIASRSSLKLSEKRIYSEAEASEVLEMIRNETWELSSRETAKMLLLTLSDHVHFLIMSMHHIMADGYSFSVLLHDLEVAYVSKHLPPLPVESQYRSFASQQRRLHELGGSNQAIQYYRDALSPAIAYHRPVQLLPFSKSTTRQALTRYDQEEAKTRIGSGLKNKVRNLARRNQSTSFHVYLAALQALLFTLLPSSTQDIFIGMADANRTDKQFMNSTGFFLNLLPLRFRRSQPNTTVGSAIQAARDTAYGALSHSQIPFDVLLRELNVPRSNDYTPLFQVFVDYKQVYQDLSSWAGCKLSDETWRNTSTGYDIVLDIHENVNTEAIIHLRLQSTLYSKESTDALLRSYVNVLEYMTDAADATVGGVPTWDPHDIQAALAAGRGAPLESQWPSTFSHRVDEIIATHRGRPSLKDGNGMTFTYEQMGARVDAIANTLLASDIIQGTVVGVFQEPSADWICSMLAVLRAGCIYLPLDLRNSIPRLASIVKAAQPSILLTDYTTTNKVPLIGAKIAKEVLVPGVKNPQEVQHSPNRAEHDAPAVILFTSGSTGEPKGIVMKNKNLVANAEANSQIYGTTPNLKVLQQSAFSFDFSIDQTLAALANGGCLYVVPAHIRGDPVEISKIMLNEKVTYTSSTPSEYDMWLRYASKNLSCCEYWRHAFSGGEAMSRPLALEFTTLNLPQLHVFTGYGPAETTCFSTKIELDFQALPDPLPAGFMLPGYTCIIVDEDLHPVPVGIPGEIVIGGPCVVSGYLNNDESTKRKFIPDTFFGSSTAMYRSGDRGRLQADGTLYCDGRLEGDMQIKLRGFRVELAEVEKAIIKHAGGALSQAIVTLCGSGEEGYLAAYVVFTPEFPHEDRERMIQAIRYSLPLPPYMRPSAILTLDDIPKTAHLKVDRKALQALPFKQAASQGGNKCSDTLGQAELKLSELWRQVMPFDPGPLTADSDFFLVGGNSILLVRLQELLRKAFSTAPKLVTLMGAPTLAAMAAVAEISRSSQVIDWEAETQPPELLSQRRGAGIVGPTRDPDGITILLTGSRGYLGRHLLPSLVSDDKVSRVYCLVREHDGDSGDDSKVSIIRSDVSQPSLGLSDDVYATLLVETDAIIHCAANRSLWDRYEVLRPDNYDSVKELARLAAEAPHPVPLHFLSSGAVGSYDNNSAVPPQDGSDGYLSTKWAAEKFLQRFAAATEMPVYIHRPEASSATKDVTSASPGSAAVLDQLAAIANQIGLKPSFDGIRGSVHVIPVVQVVQAVRQAVHDSTGTATEGGAGHNHDAFRMLHHKATIGIPVDHFKTRLGDADSVHLLPSFPLLDWFGKAKRAGFGYLITAWELSMGSDNEVISRR